MKTARFIKPIIGFFTRNIILKIVSVIFGLILWNYVMMEINPPRDKQVDNVPLRFVNEDILSREKLCVRGDRKVILKNVSVVVGIELRSASTLTKDDITATVDLQSIKAPGRYVLQIRATCNLGKDVVSVTPSTIEVEVDTLSVRPVPVTAEFEGTLPEGYWRSPPEITPQYINLEGPTTDLRQVQKAVCFIPLEGRTSQYNDAINVVLMDDADVVKDPASFTSELPSVIVKMDVYPKKTVPITYNDSLLGADKIAVGYEILDIRLSQPTAEIVGPQQVLDGITSLTIDSVNLQNAAESVMTTLSVNVPQGVVLISQASVVLFVDIAEIVDKQVYDNVPLNIFGLNKKLTATLSQSSVSVNATGPLSKMKQLEKRLIEASVDLTGMEEGTHVVSVGMSLPEKLEGIELTRQPETIIVTIKKR